MAAAAPDAARVTPQLSWSFAPSPFRLQVDAGSDRLVAHGTRPSAGPGRRLGFRLTNGEHHSATSLLQRTSLPDGDRFTLATTDPARTIVLEVTRNERGVAVTWAPVPPDDVDTVSESFAASTADHFLGSGARDRVDMRGAIVPLKVWNNCRTNMPMPFVMSSRGWALRIESDSVGKLAFPGTTDGPAHFCALGTTACDVAARVPALQVCLRAQRMTYELYAGDFPRLVALHAAAVGRPPLPPRSQFALIKWRDSVRNEQELVADIAELRSRRIPIGWVLLDNPWEADRCIGRLRFDTTRFPDPARLIDDVHSLGVRLMLWVSPYVNPTCEAGYSGMTIAGDGVLSAIDLTNPAALSEYQARLRALIGLGVDGIKGDRGDEIDIEQERVFGGWGTDFHNRFAFLFASSVTEVLRESRGADFATMFRAGSIGSQHVLPGVWAGDLSPNFDGLQTAVRLAQSSGVSGYPFWGSDVGGYGAEPNQSSEAFVRWAQLGAISPILEVGGVGTNARFWEFGPTAVEGMRRAAQLHYELHPYHYELARLAARTGMPILRPVALHYPDDARAWAAEQQLLVGRDLLAAPVTSAGNTVAVYLPAGDWLDLNHGTRQAGPTMLRRPTPLLELPLYQRVGSAVPFDARLSIWKAPWTRDDLSRHGRAGWLVAAGQRRTTGRSTDYGTLEARRTGSTLELSVVTGRPEVQVILAGEPLPQAVTIGGVAMERASQAALRSRASGWTVSESPSGIVLKLDASAGSAKATLQLPA